MEFRECKIIIVVNELEEFKTAVNSKSKELSIIPRLSRPLLVDS